MGESQVLEQQSPPGVDVIPVQVAALQVAHGAAGGQGEASPAMQHAVVVEAHNITWQSKLQVELNLDITGHMSS